MGNKPEIIRAENRECSGRQVRNHADQHSEETSGGKWAEIMGAEKLETSAKSCRPKHSEHPECTARQVGHKPEIVRTENQNARGMQLQIARRLTMVG